MANVPTISWDETKPAATRDVNLGDDDIREFKKQVREILSADHEIDSSGQGENWGKHNIITLLVQTTIAALADAGKLYAKDVDDVAELHYKDEDGNEIQITTGGALNAAGLGVASQATGDILYASAANAFSRLGIGSEGQSLLVSSGVPAWGTPTTCKHVVVRGFELVYSSTAAVIISPGTLYHSSTEVNKTANTTLTLAVASHWWDGAVDSYAAGAGWCYIGVDSSGNIKFLGNNAPDKADTEGNTDGTKLYWYDGSSYWRVIGAVHVSTGDAIDKKFYQQGDWVYYDVQQAALSTGTATDWTDINCSDFIPAISQMGAFSFYGTHQDTELILYARTNGSSGTGHRVLDGYDSTSTDYKVNSCNVITDVGRRIEYKLNSNSSQSVDVHVNGFYVGGIR